jgi:ribosomal L31-like protein
VQDAIGGADLVVFAVRLDTIKDPIAKHARLLENKFVVDPPNPLGFDENGQMIRTLPGERSVGSIALAAGIGLIVDAAATNSSATSLVGGFGSGAAFLGGLRALVVKIPPQHPGGGDVRVLHRRLRLAVGASDPGWRRRFRHLVAGDLRDLRQRRRSDRSRRRLRSPAHPPRPTDPAHRAIGRHSLTQHPETHLIEVVCAACSAAFTVRLTAASLSVDVCSNCHPA